MHSSSSYILHLVAIFAQCSLNEAFVSNIQGAHKSSVYSSTELHFGIPTFGRSKDDEAEDDVKGAGEGDPTKNIGMSGLVQLITAGMGSPFLGNFEGVEKETGKMMFSLEANNLVDEKGNSKQTAMPYFENGWVDEEDLEKEKKKKKKKKSDGKFKLW